MCARMCAQVNGRKASPSRSLCVHHMNNSSVFGLCTFLTHQFIIERSSDRIAEPTDFVFSFGFLSRHDHYSELFHRRISSIMSKIAFFVFLCAGLSSATFFSSGKFLSFEDYRQASLLFGTKRKRKRKNVQFAVKFISCWI